MHKMLKKGEMIHEEEADMVPVRKPGMVAISTGFNPFWVHVDEEIIKLAIKISDDPEAWTREKQEETAECMVGGWGDQMYTRALMEEGEQRYQDLEYAAKALEALKGQDA